MSVDLLKGIAAVSAVITLVVSIIFGAEYSGLIALWPTSPSINFSFQSLEINDSEDNNNPIDSSVLDEIAIAYRLSEVLATGEPFNHIDTTVLRAGVQGEILEGGFEQHNFLMGENSSLRIEITLNELDEQVISQMSDSCRSGNWLICLRSIGFVDSTNDEIVDYSTTFDARELSEFREATRREITLSCAGLFSGCRYTLTYFIRYNK